MNIAIWGLGVSGLGALKFLSKEKKHKIFVINQGPKETWYNDQLANYIEIGSCYSQEEAHSLVDELDLILLSPGVDPRIDALAKFTHVKKVCDIEYVSHYITKPIVAVTGTNGKTSTVTMIGECLLLSGAKVFIGGNIGRSPFEAMMENINSFDYFVFELSSFQLELMDRFCPKISVILNISENHMERYEHFDEYYQAKLNIFKNQKQEDYLLVSRHLKLPPHKANTIRISEISGYDFSKSKLVGPHMRQNFFVVENVLNILKIESAKLILQNFMNSFSGVDFRLQFKKTFKGVDFYNDAKSTNTASTVAAVNALSDKKLILILGGKLRDETQDLLTPLRKLNIPISIYLFGESASFLEKQLVDSFEITKKNRLEDVLRCLDLRGSDTVLFSPAFPSFDQYVNYVERGKDFDRLIEKLFVINNSIGGE